MLLASDSPLHTSQHDDHIPISPLHRTSVERKTNASSAPVPVPVPVPAPAPTPFASTTSTSTSTSTSPSPKPPPPRHPPPSIAVTRLQEMMHKPLTEFDARVIFTSYDDDSEMTWSPLQVRRFLGDLQQAASFPRILPDTYITIALSELQLNVDTGGHISWIEWKSYCLLQQEEPLYHLHRQLSGHAHAITYAHIPRCVIVDDLPPALSIDDILTSFASIHPQHVYFGTIDDAPIRSVLLLLSSPDDVTVALNMTSIIHQHVTLPIHVTPVQEHKEWPSWRGTQTSMPSTTSTSTSSSTTHLVSQGLALPIVLGYKAVGEVREVAAELDEKLAISRSYAGTKHVIASQLHAVDQQLGITNVVDVTTKTISEGMSQVSETLHLKEASESMKEAATDIKNQVSTAAQVVSNVVLSNPTIAEGYGWLKGWTNMVTQTLSQVTSDTLQIVKESIPATASTTATSTSTSTSSTTAASTSTVSVSVD